MSTANNAGRVAIYITGLSVKVKQFLPTTKATFSPFIHLKANICFILVLIIVVSVMLRDSFSGETFTLASLLVVTET